MQKKILRVEQNKNIELITKKNYDNLLKTIFQSIRERDNYNKILVSDIEKKNEKIEFLEDYIENEIGKTKSTDQLTPKKKDKDE